MPSASTRHTIEEITISEPDIGIQLHDERVADALTYASIAHAGQMRKGTGLPYATHLLAVASSVAEHGGTVEQVVAGLLHDVVEDCGGLPRLADVRMRFGDAVADMVEALSDSVVKDRGDKAPWKERKEAYLADLQAHAGGGAPYLLVSLADKTHNAESIVADLTDPHGDPGLAVFDRFTADPEQTAWYYRELTAAFSTAEDLPARLVLRLRSASEVIAHHAGRVSPKTDPDRTTSRPRRLDVGTRAHYGIKLADLLAAGDLEPGERLVSMRRSNPAEAELTPDGAVVFDGRRFTSPSTAAKKAQGGTSTNGWEFWGVRRGGEVVPLDALRRPYIADKTDR